MSEHIQLLILAFPMLLVLVILGYGVFLWVQSAYRRITGTGSFFRG